MSLENTPVTLAATGVTLNAEIRPGDDDSPVICLHGIWDDGKYFVELALEGAFPGQKMYLLDLRGHGESDKPGGWLRPEQLCRRHHRVHYRAADGQRRPGRALPRG
ncbi:MAG: hypothetical protein R2849_04770 [Thermomicrobiales bacterium]